MKEPSVDFLGVGPRKTATTWLDRCLRQHPELCLPSPVKETHFLVRYFDRGWDWYWRHFEECTDRQLLGEIAPSCFSVPAAAERIHAHNSRCRILISLRDPAERSYSLWLHHHRRGRVGEDFGEAVATRPDILDSSHYARHLNRWLDLFGREQVKVVLTRDISEKPETVLHAVHEFLSCDPDAALPEGAGRRIYTRSMSRWPALERWLSRASHWLRKYRLYPLLEAGKRLLPSDFMSGGDEPPGLDSELRRRLIEEFADDIDFVESLLGHDLSAWRKA